MKGWLGVWQEKFGHALRGLWVGFATGGSFYVHLPCALLVLVAGFVLQLGIVQWSLVILCTAMVLAAELFNTSIERLVRVVHPERDERVRDLLDLSAAAVLVISLAAATIGGMVFLDAVFAPSR